MSQKYVIQWVSRVNGRTGKGTKVFNRHDAETLVKELNEEYPEIHHEPAPAEEPSHPLQDKKSSEHIVPVE